MHYTFTLCLLRHVAVKRMGQIIYSKLYLLIEITNTSLESTRQYHLACIEIAKEHNIPVVDTWKLFGGHDSDLFVDGVHFSAKGNDLIFKAVRDAVVAHYPKTLDPEQMETFLPWWDTPNLDAVLENM